LQEAGPQEATGRQETHEGSSDKGEQETSHKIPWKQLKK